MLGKLAPIAASTSAGGVPTAELPPRVWTVLLAYVVVVLATGVASIAVVLLAVGARALRDPALAYDDAVAEAVFQAAADSPGVLLASAMATAVVLAVVALSAARLSPEPLRTRLALRGPRLGPAAFAVAAAGCVAVSSTFDAAFGALGLEQAGSIAQLNRIVAGLSPGGLGAAVVAGGLASPFAEELFFRGYMQTRLCLRWGTWTGIVVTAALFGLVHLDWIHSPAAFLIGLYLGWLAARSGSIAPAIAAHVANNVLWAVATSAGVGANLPRAAHAALLAVCVACALAATRWLRPRLAAAGAVVPQPPTPGGLAAE